MENPEIGDDNADGWHEPLAVKVGLGMEADGDGIPPEGWPKTAVHALIERASSYLPE